MDHSIPRSWIAGAAALFFLLAVVLMLSRPSITAADGIRETCISAWARMTDHPASLVSPGSIVFVGEDEGSGPNSLCNFAINGRNNVADGLLLLAGVTSAVLVASLVRRRRVIFQTGTLADQLAEPY